MGNCQSGACMRVSMREGYVLDCINGFHTSLRNETSYCEHMSVLQLDALENLPRKHSLQNILDVDPNHYCILYTMNIFAV